MGEVVGFLEGRGVDGAGRDVATVLAFGLGALERHHDYIQWLFPLPEPSRAVPDAPVLTDEDIAAIRDSAAAQASLTAGAARMTWFYDATDHWLVAADHNHLRITRIIRSLRLLVGAGPANAFRAARLERVARARAPVSEVALAHWRQA
jgi:hypothetical protein